MSGFFVFSQAFHLAPVTNLITEEGGVGYRFERPLLHLVLTPLCSLADYCTSLSLIELLATTVTVLVLLLIGCRWRVAVLGFIGWVLFMVVAAYVPRPMAKLVAPSPDVLLIDFHSHTKYSHDGRPSFTPKRNILWHLHQGFGAGFITDHNRIEGSQEGKQLCREKLGRRFFKSFEGEEVSLHKTHLVVLGVPDRIDNKAYGKGPASWPVFLEDMHRRRSIVIASLPEYWKYHWGKGVEDWINWGVHGFEILSSAPKALDFPAPMRREIVRLARQHNLILTGISDNHGYGYATAAWNAMVIPGWQQVPVDQLEQKVLDILHKQRFNAVTVLSRTKYLPNNLFQKLVSPWVNAVVYARSLDSYQLIAWLMWIWVVWSCWGIIRLNRKGGV